MGTIISMLWKLLKVYGGKLIYLAIKLLKAQLRALIWKWGMVIFMLVVTFTLAWLVLR